MTEVNVFVLELVPLRGEKNWSPAHKTGSWYLLVVLFKIFDEHPSFLYGRPPGGMHRLPPRINPSIVYFAVADPDLELRGGPVLIYLPWRPFSRQSFLLFFTQNKGGGPAPRAPPLDPPLFCDPF